MIVLFSGDRRDEDERRATTREQGAEGDVRELQEGEHGQRRRGERSGGVGGERREDNRGRGWWKRDERRAATREQGEGRARTAGRESTDSNGGGDGWGSREEMQGERRKNENTSDFSRTRDSLHLMKRQ